MSALPPVVVSGRAVHDADLHADLVDEDDHRVRARDRAGQLAQRLAHQPGLQAGLHVAHLAVELGLRGERRDRVDHEHVDRAGAHERVGDLERLLAGVGLRDQEVVEVDAELARINRVERVLGVDEGADAALLLRLGDGVQRERGLARGFRPVDLDHPAARQPADAERDVEPERAGRDRLDLDRLLALAEPHDRALAEGALDLRQRRVDRLRLVLIQHGGAFYESQRRLWHGSGPYGTGKADSKRAPKLYVPVLFSTQALSSRAPEALRSVGMISIA